MGQHSTIEWTDHTFNPWWGCTKISQGCKHCYAETWANRYGHDIWGPNKARRTFGEQHWGGPLKWHAAAVKQGRRVRVFCSSMADVFEDNSSLDSERLKLWDIIAETPMLDWILLTKRPENMVPMTPWGAAWPDNVWALTSVEDQEAADTRLPHLLKVPAKVRGLSVEPLLGSVDLTPWIRHIHWVIVGGESGSSARPIQPDWVRNIRSICNQHQVAFFFKQWGRWAPNPDSGAPATMLPMGKKASGRTLDGRTWSELPSISASPVMHTAAD